MGVPGAAARSRMRSPVASSASPSSFAEQSIPDDSTPRSFAFSIFVPPGSVRADGGERDDVADLVVLRAADDLERLAAARRRRG